MFKNINKNCEGIWEIQILSLYPTGFRYETPLMHRGATSVIHLELVSSAPCRKLPEYQGGREEPDEMSAKFGEWTLSRRGENWVLYATRSAADDLLYAKRKSCESYKNHNWISLQKLNNTHSLGEICIKTLVVYSSLALSLSYSILPIITIITMKLSRNLRLISWWCQLSAWFW